MSEGNGFNVMDCMVRDKVLKSNIFSVFFGTGDNEESEITFGEYKRSRMATELFYAKYPLLDIGKLRWRTLLLEISARASVGSRIQNIRECRDVRLQWIRAPLSLQGQPISSMHLLIGWQSPMIA